MEEVLVEIKQDKPGFNSFFGSWVCRNDMNIVIDVGPGNSAGRLMDSLAAMGLDRIDYILLSHIHIDHAGALADVLARYPTAMAVCHEKAVKHLVDPSRLWEGSLSVMKEVAEIYGPPGPVDKKRLIPHTKCDIDGLEILETPGHAVHHLSFQMHDRLFAGEAGGNYLAVGDTEYLRPATPPRFFLDVCLKSVDRLSALKDQPICYAHFGKAESSRRMLEKYRRQLLLWEKIIREEMAAGDKDLVSRCMERLLEDDANLRAFQKMDEDIQRREVYFLGNTIRGFTGYIGENPDRADR